MVTIVIPVYKTEKYLDRCLQSIVNQTYRNLDIILVDDGSPDSCPQLCEDWAQKDNRIRVIHKTNKGLGMARNTGIDQAKGDYICFCDSDDYIALDTVENALALAQKDQSDVVLFGMNMTDANGNVLKTCTPSTVKTCYEGAQILDFVLPNMIEGSSKVGKNFNLNMSSCTCLLSMKLIEDSGWRFVSEREYISEDYYSLLQLYAHVQRVSILKQACYFYCHNESSLTHIFVDDRFARICHCYSAMMQMSEQLHYPERIRTSLSSQYFGNVVGAMKNIVQRAGLDVAGKMKQIGEIIRNETLVLALGKIDLASESFARKLLIGAIRTQSALLVYLLVRAKS